MDQAKKLTKIFKPIFNWHKARLDLLSCFIIALIKVRTVNLTELAVAMPGKAKYQSKYKRLQRFFRFFSFSMESIADLVVDTLKIKDEKWYLSMDRTNWKHGKRHINPLVLSIVYLGVGFPIFWTTFDKAGNSNTTERIELIQRFITKFGVDKIKCLFGDREFVGKEWFAFLKDNNIEFVMRIKDNFQIGRKKGNKTAPAKNFFRDLKPGEYKILDGKRLVTDQKLYIIGTVLKSGEYLILAADDDPEIALENYRIRWGIETLFQCLKGRGFNLEDTHMTAPDRINKLFGLLAIAFSLCHATGEWVAKHKPIKIKKHGRKSVSIFRYGLDTIREILLNISEKKRDFNKLLKAVIRPILSRKIGEGGLQLATPAEGT